MQQPKIDYRFLFYTKKKKNIYLRGSDWTKMVKMVKFLVFCPTSVFRYGDITSQIFRGLAALEPTPQNGGAKGGFVFFLFSIENKNENGKNIL